MSWLGCKIKNKTILIVKFLLIMVVFVVLLLIYADFENSVLLIFLKTGFSLSKVLFFIFFYKM